MWADNVGEAISLPPTVPPRTASTLIPPGSHPLLAPLCKGGREQIIDLIPGGLLSRKCTLLQGAM